MFLTLSSTQVHGFCSQPNLCPSGRFWENYLLTMKDIEFSLRVPKPKHKESPVQEELCQSLWDETPPEPVSKFDTGR